MTSPQVRRVPVAPYEVCAYRTRTGEVMAWIPCARLPDWERGINMSGSWSAYPTLDSKEMPKSELNGLIDPWDWSWAIVQGQKIWQAGPVLGESYNDGTNSTRVYGTGLWQLLTDKRGMFSPSRASTSSITAFDADIPFGTGTLSGLGVTIPAANKNLNLRGIAKRLVEIAIGISTDARYLPITLPTNGTFSGTASRDYPGYDMSSFGQRIYELTQIDGGPEIELIPRFTNTNRKFIEHQMVMGDPRLGQSGFYHVWASGRGIVKLDVGIDGQQKGNRFWDRGAGMDRNINLGFSEDQSAVNATGSTVPLLEEIGNLHTDVEDPANTILNGYAKALRDTNLRAITQVSPTISMNGTDGNGELSESPNLTEVSPGDLGLLKVLNHRRLPDGSFLVRIARMRGAGLNRATLDVKLL